METDWKKKYNEALNKARELNGTVAAGRDFLAEIFPELAESEDERIKRWIINFIEVRLPDAAEFESEYRAALAWLEKQKDASKAIEAVERIDKYIDEHLANAHDMKDSNPDKKYYRGWDDALAKMSEILQDVYSGKKQKEQKPNYCHYGGDPNIERCRCCFAACGGRLVDEQKPPITGNDFGWIDELKHDLEHPEELDQKVDDVLKQRKGIKTLEWSEEDEEIFNITITHLLSYAYPNNPVYCKEAEKCVAWLKYLRSQSKDECGETKINGEPISAENNSVDIPLPEWSEEDKLAIDRACVALRAYSNGDLPNFLPSELIGYADRLQSLRPSWKPSEEDINAIGRGN